MDEIFRRSCCARKRISKSSSDPPWRRLSKQTEIQEHLHSPPDNSGFEMYAIELDPGSVLMPNPIPPERKSSSRFFRHADRANGQRWAVGDGDSIRFKADRAFDTPPVRQGKTRYAV